MVKDKISIRPYGEDDLWLLERTLGDSSQMIYLNGPESKEKILKRHKRRLSMSQDQQNGLQFTILVGENDAPAGNVGYWESEYKGQKGWEMGWFVLPEFQGKGIATTASEQVISLLVKLKRYKFVFAFPSVENKPSNAICRKLGFDLVEESEDEYPAGSGLKLKVNVWRFNLPINEI